MTIYFKTLLGFDLNRWVCNNAAAEFVCRLKALERPCAGKNLEFQWMYLLLVGYHIVIEYDRLYKNYLTNGTDNRTLESKSCCLGDPSDSYYTVCDSEEYDLDMNIALY